MPAWIMLYSPHFYSLHLPKLCNLLSYEYFLSMNEDIFSTHSIAGTPWLSTWNGSFFKRCQLFTAVASSGTERIFSASRVVHSKLGGVGNHLGTEKSRKTFISVLVYE